MVGLIPFGLPVGAGDMQSASDSTSAMLDVIVIMGGSNGRSSEPGFSHCFSNLRRDGTRWGGGRIGQGSVYTTTSTTTTGSQHNINTHTQATTIDEPFLLLLVREEGARFADAGPLRRR